MKEQEAEAAPRRRLRRRLVLACLVMLLVAGLIAWVQRREIAGGFIARELARRGVQATYSVTRIGYGAQRLENVVIGDPRRPDLAARWVEVRIGIGLTGPVVTKIIARGVRLRGRIVNGTLTLGDLDKLMPGTSGGPFRLPDQNVDVADAGIALATPAGPIGIVLEGKGNLSRDFKGKAAASSRRLRMGNCAADIVRLRAAVSVRDARPTVAGPLGAKTVTCQDFAGRDVRLPLEVTLAPGLDAWIGTSQIEIGRLTAAATELNGVSGRISFNGNAARTRGSVSLGAGRTVAGGVQAKRLALAGGYELAPNTGRLVLAADASAQGVSAGLALASLDAAAVSAKETPLGPIAASLVGAARRGSGDLAAKAAFRLDTGGNDLRVERFEANSASGASLRLAGGKGASYDLGTGLLAIDSTATLSGGGFPNAELRIAGGSIGGFSGTGRIAPIYAGSAALALGTIRFGPAGNGLTRVETVAEIDGPVAGGRINGLVVPISAQLGGNGFAIGPRCTNVAFRRLALSGLVLGPTRLPLCPTGRALLFGAAGGVRGGAQLPSLALRGTLGGTPLAATAGRTRLDVARQSFTTSNLDVRLGPEGAVHRFRAATLAGAIGGSGVSGSFAGLSAKIAQVPLLIGEGQGRWSFAGGDLALDGSLKVSDEADPARFHPLVSNDFRLTLKDNRIDARGWLLHPASGTRVAEATIRHALDTGRGNAILDVPGIAFSPALQPEALTPLTIGIVALVRGEVHGRGDIAWSPEGTTSTGTFTTDDMNFAAAFGPVTGLSATIRFSDLLGLETPPGQEAHVDQIQAGIDVYDGDIRYQLLPELRVRVESGRWPFAGGELALEETVLDFSRPSAKRLTFRVTGLDAASFIQQLEFGNIAATGTFDGTVPMIFDERGGRIEGGHLIARAQGGTLSYIGELTDKDLGAYGKLAFDALKSLRYSKLTIDLDGSLDGEFVAGIELDGIARNPAVTSVPSGGISGAVAGRALGQLAKIPFEFNINVRGPFRALMATARSFEDPSLLIQKVLPDKLRDLPPTSSVQPQESETVP